MNEHFLVLETLVEQFPQEQDSDIYSQYHITYANLEEKEILLNTSAR